MSTSCTATPTTRSSEASAQASPAISTSIRCWSALAFVVAILFSGVSILAYLLLWWLVDPAPSGYWTDMATETLPPPTASADEPHDQQAA